MVVDRGGTAALRPSGARHGPRRILVALLLAVLAPLAVPPAGAAGSAPAGQRDAFLMRLERLAAVPVGERLQAVNRLFNGLGYLSDRSLWGRQDHWTTPDELLERGAGDCEDLAIGKYFALRRLGIPGSRLLITYVRDLRRARPHMVLIHRGDDGRAVVLDNRSDRVLPLARRDDLAPVYGFNERHVTVMASDGLWRAFPHAGRWRIRQWDAVLRRTAFDAAGSWAPRPARAPRSH